MSEDMLTWVMMFLIASALVSLMVVSIVLLPRGVRTMKAEFYCPSVHQSVMVRYLTRDGRQPIGVLSCTAFADRTRVTCEMLCLASNGRADREAQRDHV